MSDQVETMAYAFDETVKAEKWNQDRTVPWHGLGTPIDIEDADSAYIEKAAGLDWKAGLSPVFVKVPVIGDTTGKLFTSQEIADTFAVVRDRDNAVLGTVGKWYTPIQNDEMLAFGDALVEFGGKWETAGSLKGGKLVWATMHIPSDVLIAGQEAVELYLLLSNTFDGSSRFRADIVGERVVCANTYAVALHGAQQSWSMRHVGDLEGRLEEAREAISLTTKWGEEFKEMAERLIQVEMDHDEFDAFLHKLVPDAPKDDDGETRKRAQSTVIQSRNQIHSVRNHSNTIDDDHRNTRWGALNAVTEWAEWVRPLKSDKRVDPAEQRFLNRAFEGGTIADYGKRATKLLTKGVS